MRVYVFKACERRLNAASFKVSPDMLSKMTSNVGAQHIVSQRGAENMKRFETLCSVPTDTVEFRANAAAPGSRHH